MQESFSGFDCEHSRFGTLLCRRLGYMDVDAGSWEGNEAEGMIRTVRLTVKCPPKPMLPDTTRVHIRHRLRRESHNRLTLEREVRPQRGCASPIHLSLRPPIHSSLRPPIHPSFRPPIHPSFRPLIHSSSLRLASLAHRQRSRRHGIAV